MARKYTVKAHDTLVGIAKRFYGDGTLSGLIATANEIEDPDAINPGLVLTIPDLPQHWLVYQEYANFTLDEYAHAIAKFPLHIPPGMRYVTETVSGWYTGRGAVLGPVVIQWVKPLAAFPWIECGSVGEPADELRFFAFNHAVRVYIDGPTGLYAHDRYVEMQADGRLTKPDGTCQGSYWLNGFVEALPPI